MEVDIITLIFATIVNFLIGVIVGVIAHKIGFITAGRHKYERQSNVEEVTK